MAIWGALEQSHRVSRYSTSDVNFGGNQLRIAGVHRIVEEERYEGRLILQRISPRIRSNRLIRLLSNSSMIFFLVFEQQKSW